MSTITRDKLTILVWKGFSFPVAIQEFKLSEDAKVATYEYAGRNGAEHERVLSYRVFTMSGIFTDGSGDKTPSWYANKLRYLNDNKPGRFSHPQFGNFDCICKNLSITESGDEYETLEGEDSLDGILNIKFSLELWEHVDPKQATTPQFLEDLFGLPDQKPASDYYNTKLKYHTCDELFEALKKGLIISGTDPIRHAEWLRYDYAMRKCAWDKWQAWIEAGKPGDETASITNSNQKTYRVIAGDWGFKIARKFNVTFSDLWEINRGRKVRDTEKGAEGLYWKDPNKLWPDDILLIP